MRLDKELVNRNFFDSRSKALYEIKNGNVKVNTKVILKASFEVDDNDVIEVSHNILKYVSKGGLKLEKAINVFDVSLVDKIMLDIGSSTGGFTDCALKNDVKRVFAVDVGSNQLDMSLRNDDRVVVLENTDIRKCDLNIFEDVSIITIDISFISVTKIIDTINNIENVNEIICLIKPQFECGKEIADKYRGIPLNKEVHVNVIKNVIKGFESIGFYLGGLSFSPILGGNGNIEYISYFIKNGNKICTDVKDVVNEVFKKMC